MVWDVAFKIHAKTHVFNVYFLYLSAISLRFLNTFLNNGYFNQEKITNKLYLNQTDSSLNTINLSFLSSYRDRSVIRLSDISQSDPLLPSVACRYLPITVPHRS